MVVKPLVSVVIPTYNRRDLLFQAIDSCLASSELDMQVVVVDDGSTDGTREWVRGRYSNAVTLVTQANQGAQRARNAGLAVARGSFVKFLDDDDVLMEGALAEEVRAIEATGADVSVGNIACTDAQLRTVSIMSQPFVDDMVAAFLAATAVTFTHAVLCRREIAAVAQWDPTIVLRHDIGFLADVCSQNPRIERVPAVVGLCREHSGVRETDRPAKHAPHETERECIAILLRTVERLRTSGGLSTHRAHCAAKGLWRYAHMLSHDDPGTFRATFRHITSIQSNFMPDRGSPLLAGLDRVLGIGPTEALIAPMRRMKHAFMRQ